MRRHPTLENGQLQLTFIGGKALLFRPVKRIGDAFGMREILTVAVTVSMAMPRGVMHFEHSSNRDPAAETDKSDTGRGVYEVAKPGREGYSGEPHNHADQQCRHDVADASLK